MNPSRPPPYPHPSLPNPNFCLPHQPQQLPPPTLSSSLSSLAHLLSLSHQTLTSSSLTTIQSRQRLQTAPCPHNPNHLMPPESLFLHSLRCPSSPLSQNPSFSSFSIVDSLQYPKTLNPKNHLLPVSHQDPGSSDLLLSWAGYYGEFASNFFYKDCPGVVSLKELDRRDRMFSLPRVLCIECGDFDGRGEGEFDGFVGNGFGILASDLWCVRREVDGWMDFPDKYSHAVLCSVLRLNVVEGNDLGRWVITGSLRYGVVLDVHMRDHLCVLLRLCLKAIRREAMGFLDPERDGKSSRFECSLLDQVMMWITLQLSVLYGEANAKSFAIHLLKQCVLEAASKAMVIPLEMKTEECLSGLDVDRTILGNGKLEESLEGSMCCRDIEGKPENGEVILVTQVVAAVAALHERSFLEQKMKELQASDLQPAYQRMAEHVYISKRADEERKERPNYRAIVEHDGLLRRRSSNQETSNKTKTREELLAEERDYKRRRMSYRGKKSKRTTMQVMRDVIEEYMEEIKEAGEIVCFEKGTEEKGMSHKAISVTDITSEHERLRNSDNDCSGAKGVPNFYQEQSHFDHNSGSKASMEASLSKYEPRQRDYDEHHGKPDYRSTSQDTHGDESYSRSPERQRNYHRSSEMKSHRRERDDSKMYRSKHLEKRSSSKFIQDRYKSSHALPGSDDDFNEEKDDQRVAGKDRRSRNRYSQHGPDFLVQNVFEDRYNPTESQR